MIPIIKHAANESFLFFVCLDAHKQRKNIWYLVMITKYQIFKYQIFSQLVSVTPDQKEKISNRQQTNIFSLWSGLTLTSHKQRENIWYLVIVTVVESYNHYHVQVPYIFSLLVSFKADKREKIMGRRLEKNYSFCEPYFLSLFRP